VDSVFQTLSPRRQLAQLITIRAHSNLGPAHEASVERLLREEGVGGLCFFQGGPGRQLALVNRYQRAAAAPLLVSMDAEWGLDMRLDSTLAFPRQLILGAVRDNDLIYYLGAEIGRQLRAVGVQVNLAPVADINNNPANPVIHTRSFGENRYNVTAKAYHYAQGLRSQGVLPCFKHFPGHGDTEVDSHLGLPVIPHGRTRLDSLELYPFRLLADAPLSSMMVAHLQIPALDSAAGRPTTFSRPVVQGLLREELGFSGLIFTDAMEMGGVTGTRFPAGRAEAEALRAGNDIVLLPRDVGRTLDTLEVWLNSGQLEAAEIEAKVRRLLRTKYELGLHRPVAHPLKGIHQRLHSGFSADLNETLFQAAVTLVRDEGKAIPFRGRELTHLVLGREGAPALTAELKKGREVHKLSGPLRPSAAQRRDLQARIPPGAPLLVSLHHLSKSPARRHGISPALVNWLKRLSTRQAVVVLVFGTPYSLAQLDDLPTLVCGYEDRPIAHRVAGKAVSGRIPFRGRLPVTASPQARYGQGMSLPARSGQ
jgi:beta-glucosidase-like glycosyl hydrolase